VLTVLYTVSMLSTPRWGRLLDDGADELVDRVPLEVELRDRGVDRLAVLVVGVEDLLEGQPIGHVVDPLPGDEPPPDADLAVHVDRRHRGLHRRDDRAVAGGRVGRRDDALLQGEPPGPLVDLDLGRVGIEVPGKIPENALVTDELVEEALSCGRVRRLLLAQGYTRCQKFGGAYLSRLDEDPVRTTVGSGVREALR